MKKNLPIHYLRYTFRKELAMNLVKKYIPGGSKFLEIGCATGDFGITLSGLGYYGRMIDFSEEAAWAVKENLRRHNIINLTFEKKDILNFESKEHFDFIIMLEVLEHIEDDKNVLKKINSLLNSDGFLLLSVPAKKELWAASDELVGHVRRYEKEEIKNILNEAEFKIIKFYSYGYPFLNIVKKFIDYLFAKRLKKIKKNRIELSGKSGLIVIKIPILKYIFNKYILFPFIQFSRLFHRYDLSEGYLCLAKKYEKREQSNFKNPITPKENSCQI